jgi:hypothetical protein
MSAGYHKIHSASHFGWTNCQLVEGEALEGSTRASTILRPRLGVKPALRPALQLASIVVTAHGMVRVCAWHTPPAELAAINRAYPDRVTHGLCPTCSAALHADLDASA